MESQGLFSYTYMRVLAAITLGLLALSLAAYSHATLQSAREGVYGPTTINVRGEGEVVAVPDIGMFSFSVEAKAETAEDAQSASATAINDIVDYLAGRNIADTDIKTSGYNLNPNYRYEETDCGRSFCPSEQVLDGYVVTQTVQVKVREVDQAGDLISGVGERGATNISGLSFTIDDDSQLAAEARTAAIVDAQTQAEQLARDLGMRLGRMVSFYEEQSGPYGEPMFDSYAKSATLESASPQIPMGENTTTKVVNITYEVK